MFEFTISIENGCILAVTGGTLTKEDLYTYKREILRIAKENDIPRILVDHRALSLIATDLDCALELAEYFSEYDQYSHKTRNAVVMNSKNYGAASLAEATCQSNDISYRVFTDMHEAKKWLGVDTAP